MERAVRRWEGRFGEMRAGSQWVCCSRWAIGCLALLPPTLAGKLAQAGLSFPSCSSHPQPARRAGVGQHVLGGMRHSGTPAQLVKATASVAEKR
jgi:hypothetical protein